MIKRQFIKKQIEKSHHTKCTTLFLRRLIFQTVDVVTRAHYGNQYCMKCLQTSTGVQILLAEMGIKSRLTFGAVCVPKILKTGEFGGWTGFWGDDHHVWLETEFGDVVDLSISQLHQHPRTKFPEIKTPAVWWNQRHGWPPFIRYLFDTQVDKIELADADDQTSYEEFSDKVKAEFSVALADKFVQDIAFSPMLDDVDQVKTWAEENNPWATGALTVLEYQIAFPPWIVDRQWEIESALDQGKLPKSRLSERADLFG